MPAPGLCPEFRVLGFSEETQVKAKMLFVKFLAVVMEGHRAKYPLPSLLLRAPEFHANAFDAGPAGPWMTNRTLPASALHLQGLVRAQEHAWRARSGTRLPTGGQEGPWPRRALGLHHPPRALEDVRFPGDKGVGT